MRPDHPKNRRRAAAKVRSGAQGHLRRKQSASLIGREDYFLSADGLLMPAENDQPPPDLRSFNSRGNDKRERVYEWR